MIHMTTLCFSKVSILWRLQWDLSTLQCCHMYRFSLDLGKFVTIDLKNFVSGLNMINSITCFLSGMY